MTRTKLIIGCVVATSAVSFIGGWVFVNRSTAPLPTYPAPEREVWLDQNWSEGQRAFYRHANQGATTFGIPYEWFMALEQPRLSLFSLGLFSDSAYLDRYGFITSKTDAAPLPIGFEYGQAMINPTTQAHWTNPATGRDMTTVGLTCAACHTARMTYKGTAIYVDGGPALIDIDAVRKNVSVALYMTKYVPFRFDRFADRVLGKDAAPAARNTLWKKLDEVLGDVKMVGDLDDKIADRSVPEGFGRLDALNRIGNQLFALGVGIDENYAPTNAPVRYPQIWGSSRFDWVEWNGSIQQPMVRNGGEALGLGVKLDLTSAKTPSFRSNMDVPSIFKVEDMLRGPTPAAPDTGVTGLRSPRWPETILPPIDKARAARGAELYASLCEQCHLPPVGSAAFYDPKYRQSYEPKDLIVPLAPVDMLGTDPAQAAVFANRKVDVPPGLGLHTNAYGPALAELVEKAVVHWYDRHDISPRQRERMNGELPNGVRTPVAYKARPLDGIWSVAPYLHNGSVPTLYALLQPVAERPERFTIGSREFDPVNVGLRSDPIPGGTIVDTSVAGNHNTGHEFDDAPGRPGVIGRKLSNGERRDLVEFLKTL